MSAGNAGRPRTGPAWPRKGRAVGLGGVCGGEHERVVFGVGAELAEPFDRAGERELGAAEPLDEVATPAGADRLERAQLAVDGAVAAGDALAAHTVAHDDALPLEQELGERPSVDRGREQARGERPAALRRCRSRGARA